VDADGEEFDYESGTLKQHELASDVPEHFNIAIATWNVNGGKYLTKDTPVNEWLVTPIAGRPVDIFAVGFQEIVDLNVKEIMATSAKARKEWSALLTKVLNAEDSSDSFALVTSEQLVGCCVYVFVNEKHLHAVRDVAVDIVKTGVGGKVGNKGGTALRFRFYTQSLCFVCAHLPAGQGKASERNDDYHDITRKLDFGKGRTVDSHDFVVWFGDFNYRIDHDIDEIKRLIADGELQKLIPFDQLTRERDGGNVFEGYNEGSLSFIPTYKYDIMLDKWDLKRKTTSTCLDRPRPLSWAGSGQHSRATLHSQRVHEDIRPPCRHCVSGGRQLTRWCFTPNAHDTLHPDLFPVGHTRRCLATRGRVGCCPAPWYTSGSPSRAAIATDTPRQKAPPPETGPSCWCSGRGSPA